MSARFSPLLQDLIDALRCLPGVGQKTAQRMAFHLLERQRQQGVHLSVMLNQAMAQIQHCQICRNFTEQSICQICAHPRRNQHLICIVETPADVLAIEQAATFHGRYFVLMGRLSPLDGIGPKELHLDVLQKQLSQPLIEEIILATNTTVEGEATAHYIAQMAKNYQIPCSRIAHGVPLGGELEYVDSGTLAHAFSGRKAIILENAVETYCKRPIQ